MVAGRLRRRCFRPKCGNARRKGTFYFLRLRAAAAGGEGGIRTPDTLASMPHFECGAFNHSATSPEPETGPKGPRTDGAIYPRAPVETRETRDRQGSPALYCPRGRRKTTWPLLG